MAETLVVRRFSDDKLQAAVDRVLSRLPEGHTVALVAHADLEGASLTAVGKIGDHWSLSGTVSKPWNGPLDARAEVVASW